MENQDAPRRLSKEVCTSGLRIKVHKRTKKVESAPNIRVHGWNILRQLVQLKRLISMLIMPKRSLVHEMSQAAPLLAVGGNATNKTQSSTVVFWLVTDGFWVGLEVHEAQLRLNGFPT